MEVDGGEVSLTNYGRTRDSGLRLVCNRSRITSYACLFQKEEKMSNYKILKCCQYLDSMSSLGILMIISRGISFYG